MRWRILPTLLLAACGQPGAVHTVDMEARRPTAARDGVPALPPPPHRELQATIDGVCELVDGVVRCAGRNTHGEIGDGTLDPHPEWFRVPGTDHAVQLAAGGQHVCVRLEDGTARCWGENEFGQLGDGVGGKPRLTPVDVVGVRDIVELRAGTFHTCARVRNGDVLCWGGKIDSVGLRYDRDPASRLHPTRITSNASQLVLGHERTYARTQGGWSTWAPRRGAPPTPTPLSELDDVIAIASGWADECALTSSGEVRCWGASHPSSFPRPHEPSAARRIPDLPPITRLTVGRAHACASSESGEVHCWTEIHGHRRGAPQPTQIAEIRDAVDVTAGFDFTCARLRDGSVKCWGRNEHLPAETALPAVTPEPR